MKIAFIIHGTKAGPKSNWFSWLGEKLQEKGYIVIIPSFPSPENQNYDTWKEKLQTYQKYISKDTIFIAHSIGPAFICRYLLETQQKVRGCYFVAGFIGQIGVSEYDELNASFFETDFTKTDLQKLSDTYYLCYGDNDPYVPQQNAQKLADIVGVRLDIIRAGGHLNSDSGYTEFPYLLEKIA